MKKKVIIGFLVIIILIAIGGIVISFGGENAERTNEEYVSIFLENREDFDYVAEKMKQWPDGSIIYFKEDNIFSENSEIVEEISTNEEFDKHLKNLHTLNEVWYVVKWSDWTEFCFRDPPKDYHGGWYYWESTEEGGLLKTEVIDEHWTLEMLPNV